MELAEFRRFLALGRLLSRDSQKVREWISSFCTAVGGFSMVFGNQLLTVAITLPLSIDYYH